jgi:hypothetical protein
MRLQSAREVLYPVTIFLLELCIPDPDHLDAPWPQSFGSGSPLNIIASASLLEKIQRDKPALWQTLQQRVQENKLEVCGGCYLEREDNLLPLESQIWNLLKGRAVSENLLGKPVTVFARKRFYAHPQVPMFLSSVGLNRALMLTLDDSALPQYSSTTVSWPSPDGKIVDIFVRAPFKAGSGNALQPRPLSLQDHPRGSLGHTGVLALAKARSALDRGFHRTRPFRPDLRRMDDFSPLL